MEYGCLPRCERRDCFENGHRRQHARQTRSAGNGGSTCRFFDMLQPSQRHIQAFLLLASSFPSARPPSRAHPAQFLPVCVCHCPPAVWDTEIPPGLHRRSASPRSSPSTETDAGPRSTLLADRPTSRPCYSLVASPSLAVFTSIFIHGRSFGLADEHSLLNVIFVNPSPFGCLSVLVSVHSLVALLCLRIFISASSFLSSTHGLGGLLCQLIFYDKRSLNYRNARRLNCSCHLN